MGGRLVLIRSVLSSLPVYWMALIPIPSSILDNLRKLILSFLWGSSTKKKKFHLVDWHLLARPMSLGGWGIKHLPSFSLSLRLKSLWNALNSTGIWNLIMSVKYMKNWPVHSWLREKCFRVRNVSVIWKGFLSTLPWLGKGILWQVGNGSDIRLGVDPIVGLGCSFILLGDLRAYLEDYGICTLAQSSNETTFALGYWFSAEDLDLCGDWKYVWDNYVRGLEYSRIRL